MAAQDVDITQLKYLRVGHIDEGRFCDELAYILTDTLPGDVLPQRWSLVKDFVQKYGEGLRWAKTASYHMLLLNGIPVLRLWTVNNSNYAWLDLHHNVASQLIKDSEYSYAIEPIPKGSLKKCKPFEARTLVVTEHQLLQVVDYVKRLFGL